MTPVPDPIVSRPTPTAEWAHDWHWRGRLDIHGFRRLEVKARFSSNEEPVDNLPNEIVVEYLHGQGRSRETVRLSRDAAEHLVNMLNAALHWDGE